MAGTWLLLGWQAHVPLTAVHITRIGLVLVAAAFAQPLPQALLRKQGKVFLLLLGVLLLWPQEAVLTFFPLAVALLAALVIIFILRIVIYEVLDMAGIELRWPGE
jgi:O-methyltransferase involved in polyketide biosynthesis